LIPCNGQAAAPDLQRQAGRQAGSMCFIQDPIPKVPFRCYDLFSFLLICRHLQGSEFFLEQIFSFFQKKLGFFLEMIFFSSLNLTKFAIFWGKN
jgi:hypothetical protein